MPKVHPKEFRDASLAEIAKDFGISAPCLRIWLSKADLDDGRRLGLCSNDSAELRELKLRRAAAFLSQANLPGNHVPAHP